MLNPEWDFDARNIAVVRVGGKGNFRRYREFFGTFGLEVRVITDLDALVDQFGGLGPEDECIRAQGILLQEADRLLSAGASTTLSGEQKRQIANSRAFQQRYDDVRAVVRRARAGQPIADEDLSLLDELFAGEESRQRCWALRARAELAGAKEALLVTLRRKGIHVFSRGSLEDYYPAGMGDGDKPSRALGACALVADAQGARNCCLCIADGTGGRRPEFDLLFEDIFAV
jgi:putative ATP-dependent endonuclease of OLD family